MGLALLALTVLVYILIIISSFYTDSFYKKERTIKVNDVNVGDLLKIKGASYKVKAYTGSGVFEVEARTFNNETYIIKIDDSVKIKEHRSGKRRLYITFEGFDGTVGADYLEKIKFTK